MTMTMKMTMTMTMTGKTTYKVGPLENARLFRIAKVFISCFFDLIKTAYIANLRRALKYVCLTTYLF